MSYLKLDDGTMWYPMDVVTPIAGARSVITLLVLHLFLSPVHIHTYSFHQDTTVGLSMKGSSFLRILKHVSHRASYESLCPVRVIYSNIITQYAYKCTGTV